MRNTLLFTEHTHVHCEHACIATLESQDARVFFGDYHGIDDCSGGSSSMLIYVGLWTGCAFT